MALTTSELLFDCLVVGAGPAGLSAALALCRVNLTAVVFTTSIFRNDYAPHAHSVLTQDHVPPSGIRSLGRKDISRYATARFVDHGIVSARKVDEVFEVTDTQGEKWTGKKVILATGSRDVFPDIEGYRENWGLNIYQCLFCDGFERRKRSSAVLGFPGPIYLHFVNMMLQLGCPEVVILGNGKIKTDDEAVAQALEVARYQGVQIDERKVSKLVNLEEQGGVKVEFEEGEPRYFGFLVQKLPTVVVAKQMAEQLGVEVEVSPSGDEILKRNEPFGESNVKGVFVAGDVGTALKNVTGAMYSGGAAGAGVNFSLLQDLQMKVAQEIGGRKDALKIPDMAATLAQK